MSEIVIFEVSAKQVEVHLKGDSLWLTQNQMADLFDVQKSAISKHLKNIFESGELEPAATVSKMETVQTEGQRVVTRQVEHYNLDAIISVGYRVNSTRATRFRQWATRVLREHLVQGYTLNQQRLAERGIEFEQAVALLSRTLSNRALVNAEGAAVLGVIADYARTWSLLQQYDEQSLANQTRTQTGMRALALEEVLADGNKRCGSFLFLWYLRLNQHLLARPVENLVNDNTLVALALLVAESQPEQKELMVRLIEQFVLLKTE